MRGCKVTGIGEIEGCMGRAAICSDLFMRKNIFMKPDMTSKINMFRRQIKTSIT